MIRPAPTFALAALLALSACGGGNSSSDKLEEAAEQSDPAAAAVLENAADSGVPAQQALQDAGNAQAATVAGQQPEAPAPAQGAKPHAPGDPVPPSKVPVGEATSQQGSSGQGNSL